MGKYNYLIKPVIYLVVYKKLSDNLTTTRKGIKNGKEKDRNSRHKKVIITGKCWRRKRKISIHRQERGQEVSKL